MKETINKIFSYTFQNSVGLCNYENTKFVILICRSSIPISKDPGNEEITSSEDEKESEEEEEEKEKDQQPRKKRKLEDYSSELSKIQAKFVGFRNTTIQKWNDKTRVAQGKLSSKNFSAFEQSTLKQIEQVMTDKQRLLKRTRMKRSGYRILGEPEKSVQKDKVSTIYILIKLLN
jgi:protein AATF/BFR2